MTLRIQRTAERKLVVFTLTGRIQADQVPELEALLQSSDGDIVLDLRDVRLVDRDAVRFLAQQEAGGTKLRNCSAYIREWISQERNRLQGPRAGSNGEPSGLEG
jgi:anti-anti-sigma regulatory factor